MLCGKCGTQVVDGAQFCTQCGQFLGGPTAPHAPVAAGDDEYLETAIGHSNLDYYLQRFEKFSSGRGLASWNWPAFFVPLVWMLYRKMWVYALVNFFAVPIAVFAIFFLLFVALPPTAAAVVGWTIQLAIAFVLIPMYANALYYRTVRNRIADAKAYRGDREKQLRMLASTGGTSNAALIVVVIMIVPTIGILAAIAIPAYQDYTTRAQVSEGLSLAAAAKAGVAEAFLNPRIARARTCVPSRSATAASTSSTAARRIPRSPTRCSRSRPTAGSKERIRGRSSGAVLTAAFPRKPRTRSRLTSPARSSRAICLPPAARDRGFPARNADGTPARLERVLGRPDTRRVIE
jgi:Tfp pilus assembly major pilin PilA